MVERLACADQPGDADRVELVEVGGADRDEAQPLQQRMARVLRLLQHTRVEVEPGQFAVDEAAGLSGVIALAISVLRASMSVPSYSQSRYRLGHDGVMPFH